MVIGIPRALLYYKYGVLWEGFLKNLGFKVVVSPPTTKPILEAGLDIAESEICMPVKIFYGHVNHLLKISRVDAIFLPRMVAVEKSAYTCPKFLGLPDMIRAAFPRARIITEDFNRKLGMKSFYGSFLKISESLKIGRLKALKAIKESYTLHNDFQKRLHRGMSYYEAIVLPERRERKTRKEKNKLVIGIAAHSYNIYDSYFSLNLLRKLESFGVSYITPDNVPHRIWSKYSSRLPKFLFWTYERELVGSAFYWIENGMVDGIIYVMSFSCGPDSIVQYLLENETQRFNVPMLTVVLDEHSAEAGLLTRLEAFLDMLQRKKS